MPWCSADFWGGCARVPSVRQHPVLSVCLSLALEDLLAPPSLCPILSPRMLLESRSAHPSADLLASALCPGNRGLSANLVRSFWYGPSAFWSMLSSPCYHWPPRTPQRGQSQDPSALDASLNLSNTHSPLSQLWKEKSELHWNLNPSHLCFPMTLQPPPPPHPAGQENGGEGLSFTGQPMAWPCLAPERGANPLSQSCLAVGTALALRNPLLEFRSWNYSFLWISSVFLLIPNLREPLWKPGSRVSCLRTPHDGQATSSIELILLSL